MSYKSYIKAWNHKSKRYFEVLLINRKVNTIHVLMRESSSARCCWIRPWRTDDFNDDCYWKWLGATMLETSIRKAFQSWRQAHATSNSLEFDDIRIELHHSSWTRGAWAAAQPRTVLFWSCLTGRWRLFRAFSIPFSREVSLGAVSCIAALARSLAASINLSVLSFASNAMVFEQSSIKSYTHNSKVSANPSSFFQLSWKSALRNLPFGLRLQHQTESEPWETPGTVSPRKPWTPNKVGWLKAGNCSPKNTEAEWTRQQARKWADTQSRT